ncbi:MAG: Uma2 family endonuclease [Caldilineaceae bacterium]
MDSSLTKRGPWTSADLDLLPVNGVRYEIVDGDLFMSKAPHWHHQRACGKILRALDEWSQKVGLGEAVMTPGVLFDEADDVIPDVVWISSERLAALMDKAGHLTGAPELAVEVLSFGEKQENRDRQFKRKLYETQGVREYWIADWRLKQVEVYRREQGLLRLVATLLPEDTVTSPLLPGFACPVARFFD